MPTPFQGSLVALTVALSATLLLPPASSQAEDDGPTPPAETSSVTMVHANILTGMPLEKFQSDVSEVLAQRPDFVTYNEVPYRQDGVLAPGKYELWRNSSNRYTGATPVAWRADRWTRIDQGTRRISNYRKVPKGRHTQLGLRFANWVTLTSDDGRRLSVVSAHVAPLVRDMPDLRRASVARLGQLVEDLSASGPVLVGGDFNLHYRSGMYPRDVLTAAKMVPTYDTLGGYFPTGDHGGHTIDFVFNRGAGQLVADQHRPIELHSDHDAVVAGLSWTSDAPTQTELVTNDPSGERVSRRATVTALLGHIRSAEAGTTIELVTSDLGLSGVRRQLKEAVDRGVRVRLTTRSETLSPEERRLSSYLAAPGDRRSQVRRCRGACLVAWEKSDAPRTLMMLREQGRESRLRVDLNRTLTQLVVERKSKLTAHTGDLELARGDRMLSAVY